MCVCLYACLDRPLTGILNEHIQIFRKIDITIRVQHQGPGAKTTEVEAHVALVCASTDDGRLLTDGTNLNCMDDS